MNTKNYTWTYYDGRNFIHCTSFPSAFKKLYHHSKKETPDPNLKIMSPFNKTYDVKDAFRLADDQGLLDKMGNLKQNAYKRKP